MVIYLHFLHATELAYIVCLLYIVRLLYNAIGYGRVEDTRIRQVVSVVLFKKEFGGLDNTDHEPPKELAAYDNVFRIHDRFACMPICLINAMCMTINANGKIFIDRVTFNAHMITKVVEYICLEDNWPALS